MKEEKKYIKKEGNEERKQKGRKVNKCIERTIFIMKEEDTMCVCVCV